MHTLSCQKEAYEHCLKTRKHTDHPPNDVTKRNTPVLASGIVARVLENQHRIDYKRITIISGGWRENHQRLFDEHYLIARDVVGC